jgi:hypothetical protein
MKDDAKKDAEQLEQYRQIWDNIIDYERAWLKAHNNSNVPVQKLLEYFGIQTICKLYGCTVYTENIARELINQAFA